MTRLYIRIQSALSCAVKREDGIETLEWIAMGGVVLVMLGAISAYMSSTGGNSIAQTLVTQINAAITGIIK